MFPCITVSELSFRFIAGRTMLKIMILNCYWARNSSSNILVNGLFYFFPIAAPGIEPKALQLQGKCSTVESHPSAFIIKMTAKLLLTIN